MQEQPKRLPVKLKTIDLGEKLGEDYQGLWFKVRTNIKLKTLESLSKMKTGGMDFSAFYESFSKVIYEWNFLDEDGNLLSQPKDDPSVLAELDLDLILVIKNEIISLAETLKTEAAGGDLKNLGVS